jgi:hypothetical protein
MLGKGPLRPRRGVAGLLGLSAALAAAGGLALAPSASRAATADPAALPAQPGTPAAPCTPEPTKPNTWDTVGEPTPVQGGYQGITFQPYRVVMDPWRPCLGYRVIADGRRLERTTDTGASWRPVFFDDRRSATGGSFRITAVAVPAANTVIVGEDGNGVAVIRSTDAGATWMPANGGIAGHRVSRLWISPSDPKVAYAAEDQSPPTGPVTIWVTRDGGASWTRQAAFTFVYEGFYSGAVDPTNPGTFFVIAEQPGATVLIKTHDYGTTAVPGPADTNDVNPAQVADLLAARRPKGALRLYWLTNTSGSAPNGIRYSDDEGATWTEVAIAAQVKWSGGLVDPTNGDRVLYFGTPQFQGHTDVIALYTRDGFATQEYGRQPPIKSNRLWGLGRASWTVDQLGHFYLDLGVECPHEGCRSDGPASSDSWYLWRTVRFHPPDFGQALQVTTAKQSECSVDCGGTFQQASTCTVQPQPPLYPRLSTQADDSGAIASDGAHLYYTVRGETGPDPLSAVIRVADPVTCRDTGRLVVHFDPAAYADARRRAVSDLDGHPAMLPTRPAIDSLAYDSAHDTIWFSLDRTAGYVAAYNGDTNAPFPLWSAPRAGAGPDRQAQLRFWTQPCAQGGVGLLAYDRGTDMLWTCDDKIPGERSPAGDSQVVCLHPLFQGTSDTGWEVEGWGMAAPGTLVVFRVDRGDFPPELVDVFDTRNCKLRKELSIPALQYQGNPKQAGPEYISRQAACDPLTFRAGLPAAPAPAAVMWTRRGPSFSSWVGPGIACPSPTRLAYSGPGQVDPGRVLDACATATVPGPSAPLAGIPVRISVAGAPARAAASDASGRACVPYDVPAGALAGSRIPVQADVPADAHVLASSAAASVLVGRVPAPAPVLAPPLPRPAPAPIPVPAVPLPAPAPSPQPAVQPGTPPPPQAGTQQGFAGEKEREVQLAHAQQESTGDDAALAEAPAAASSGDNESGGYAFAAVLAGAVAMGALALGRSRIPAPQAALMTSEIDPESRRSRRPRHRRRR